MSGHEISIARYKAIKVSGHEISLARYKAIKVSGHEISLAAPGTKPGKSVAMYLCIRVSILPLFLRFFDGSFEIF